MSRSTRASEKPSHFDLNTFKAQKTYFLKIFATQYKYDKTKLEFCIKFNDLSEQIK